MSQGLMMKKLIIFGIAALFIPATANSLSLYDRQVEELYSDASLVVYAQVRSISANCTNSEHCWGYKLTFFVKNKIKGPKQKRKFIDVCSEIPLEIGVDYTLFLHDYSYQPITGMSKCNLLLPRDSAFEKRSTQTYRINSPEGSASIKAYGRTYWTNAVREEDFEVKMLNLSKDNGTK